MNPNDAMLTIIRHRMDQIFEELADLAEAHREWVGGCLDEDEYQAVCDQADKLNAELDNLVTWADQYKQEKLQ